MYHYNFNTLKWGLLQLICDIAPPPPNYTKQALFNSNRTLFNSNIFLHSQYIQIKPSITQMYVCTPNTHKWGFLQFICIIAPSNHSNQVLFTSNAPLHSWYTWISPFNPQMCLWPSNTLTSCPFQLKCAFASSIDPNNLQCFEMCMIASNQLKSSFL